MFGQANTSIIFHWFQPTRRRGMGEQLVAHATGNCKPCSFFFFKEQCHSTYDKWQEVYGCFGICMHLNDLGWGCRTQDSTGGRVGRGGWDQNKIRRAKVRHYSHLQYLVVGIANLPYIRIIRIHQAWCLHQWFFLWIRKTDADAEIPAHSVICAAEQHSNLFLFLRSREFDWKADRRWYSYWTNSTKMWWNQRSRSGGTFLDHNAATKAQKTQPGGRRGVVNARLASLGWMMLDVNRATAPSSMTFSWESWAVKACQGLRSRKLRHLLDPANFDRESEGTGSETSRCQPGPKGRQDEQMTRPEGERLISWVEWLYGIRYGCNYII